MAAVRRFGVVGGSRGTTHGGPFMVAIADKNFVMIGLVVFKLSIWIYFPLALESPIYEPEISVIGDYRSHPQKAHPCAQ